MFGAILKPLTLNLHLNLTALLIYWPVAVPVVFRNLFFLCFLLLCLFLLHSLQLVLVRLFSTPPFLPRLFFTFLPFLFDPRLKKGNDKYK